MVGIEHRLSRSPNGLLGASYSYFVGKRKVETRMIYCMPKTGAAWATPLPAPVSWYHNPSSTTRCNMCLTSFNLHLHL
jgi:hypothetical protein